MPELSQIYQKQLDDSQSCPLCQAAMYWIEGEIYHQPLNFHQCSHCEHCLFYGEKQRNCQCKQCLLKRKKTLKQSVAIEKNTQWKQSRKNKEDSEFLLDDLKLIDKLFLLSLLDGSVDDQRPHQEHLDFNHYYPLQIAPSHLLFKQLKNKFIQNEYLLPLHKEEDNQCFFTHLRLHGYRDPSLLSLTHQLRQWFYQDLTQGVPYKDADEVKNTLIHLMFHEIVSFCQYCCQKWQIQFYPNHSFEKTCKTLLEKHAVTQLFYWIDRALTYLYQASLLKRDNENFINANLLKKTLLQYQIKGQTQAWETPNLARPNQLPYSQMSYIFIHRFLKMDNTIFMRPIWKCWQDILPKLRFFTARHCIHCGSQNLQIEYSTDQAVSFRCLTCKQQDHYFID